MTTLRLLRRFATIATSALQTAAEHSRLYFEAERQGHEAELELAKLRREVARLRDERGELVDGELADLVSEPLADLDADIAIRQAKLDDFVERYGKHLTAIETRTQLLLHEVRQAVPEPVKLEKPPADPAGPTPE